MNSVEIASFICQQLHDIDVKTTLSGGFCAEIYSFGEYTSMDIDLIDQSLFKNIEIIKKMLELGFTKVGKHFAHPDMKYTVEFPSSPLAIGSELVHEISEIETEYGVLRIITPTDCVKDRLAGFYFWNDDRSLEQALLVAIKNKIDMMNIQKWSINEGEKEKFQIFNHDYNIRMKDK
jgi:hypothetical protein